MPDNTLHSELKTALMLLGSNISAFGRSLTKPDGTQGVSHTAVILVAQGKDETQWILDEINTVIKKARRRFPEYYKKRSKIGVTD